jgi:trk system potassium uptake protein TrkH
LISISRQVRGLKRRQSIKLESRFQPAQFLAISFIVAILVGTFLLLLPFSTRSGHISLVDALFTATSGVCVTGLIVQDTATYFTPFGQVVILILLQLGGLGIMTFSTLILLVAGRSISIKDRIIIQEGYHHGAPRDFKSLIRNIFLYALTLEVAGTLSLFIRWQKDFPLQKAIAHSAFHSISAFCNAGFSLFSRSIVSYRSDAWINITFFFLIILGGMGFLVLQEMKEAFSGTLRRRKIRISLHAKLVLTMTSFLIVFSFVLFLAIEWHHSLKMFTLKEKIFSSIFQVITPRTAGFNTMDLNSLSFPTVLLLIMLMFIGASSGSTGGGVKTSTIGVILGFLKSKVTARDSVNVFRRTLPLESVMKAFTVITLAICVIFFSSFVLLLTQPGVSMREALFEVFSAFSTVGLSLGITPKLSSLGKIMIIITMYIGRIGPLTLLYAFSRQKALGRFEYVEETVMIG